MATHSVRAPKCDCGCQAEVFLDDKKKWDHTVIHRCPDHGGPPCPKAAPAPSAPRRRGSLL